MSSRTSVERIRAGHEPALEPWRGCGRRSGSGRFLGLDVEEMNPKVRVAVSLAVLAPVILSGVLLIALAPGFWWIFTTYFWVMFPALGLLVRGVAELSEDQPESTLLPSGFKERELLEALWREGELTPAGAAMETSLSVAEADQMLKELAEGGHLEVRVRGGGLFYALWEAREGDGARGLEGR